MSDDGRRTGGANDWYPVGSPEHYTAYKEQFGAYQGIGYSFPGDPRSSYQADYACELAYEDYYANGGWPPSPTLEPYSRYPDEHHDGVLPPADPGWPVPVQDAWECFRKAREKAAGLIDASGELAETGADITAIRDAEGRAYLCVLEADGAYGRYTEAWDDWQLRGPEMPGRHEEPEAGS
jgi:hypothetical protein